MKLIVGLGNPGRRYADTPHNIGWEVVDRLAARQGWKWTQARRIDAEFCDGFLSGVDTMLLKPTTYMNLSGKAVAPLVRGEGLKVEKDLLVVYDEADLPLGRLRMRSEGSAGGHNGMRSLIDSLGGRRDFARLRIGVAPTGGRDREDSLADYVLARWPAKVKPEVERMADLAADAAEEWLVTEDCAAVMNKYNTRRESTQD